MPEMLIGGKERAAIKTGRVNTEHKTQTKKPILKYFSFKPTAGSKFVLLLSVALVDG